jgi:SAM-dependent methyltransferase
MTEYIFRDSQGVLEFIGDFDALYKNNPDPWDQSASHGERASYYLHSRERLLEKLRLFERGSLLDIGCGLGYTTHLLQESLPFSEVAGADISQTAIDKATSLFPRLTFSCMDITASDLNITQRHDIVILNQLLWYILEKLPESSLNCHRLLKRGGHLIISQAFFKNKQRYGIEMCDGFSGLLSYCRKMSNIFQIETDSLSSVPHLVYDHGLVILKRKD